MTFTVPVCGRNTLEIFLEYFLADFLAEVERFKNAFIAHPAVLVSTRGASAAATLHNNARNW